MIERKYIRKGIFIWASDQDRRRKIIIKREIMVATTIRRKDYWVNYLIVFFQKVGPVGIFVIMEIHIRMCRFKIDLLKINRFSVVKRVNPRYRRVQSSV